MLNDDNVNLLILNTDKDFSSFYTDLYETVFKHNYSVNILDVSDTLDNISLVTKAIFKINPTILCIRVFNYDTLKVIKDIVDEVNSMYVDSLILLCDISPNDINIVNVSGIDCDFFCVQHVTQTVLDMLKFFGDKDVNSELTNVWYKDQNKYTFIR